jgi:phage replication O-like protein O
MASPQKENGSTMIANEILEKLYCFPFTNRELKVLLFVIRKTWGWHKKEDTISYNQIAKGCFITRRNAIYTIKSLVSKQALVVKNGYINTISLNKDYDKWVVPELALVPEPTPPSVNLSTRVVPEPTLKLVPVLSTHKVKKDNLQKKLIQKKSIYDISEEYFMEISVRYKIPIALIKLAKEEMDNWLEAKGKSYVGFNGYKAGLRNWVLRNAKQSIEGRQNGRSRVSIDITKI